VYLAADLLDLTNCKSGTIIANVIIVALCEIASHKSS